MMVEVSQIILAVRDVGENIVSMSQDIGLLLHSEESDAINSITRVKHSKGLVESILTTLTVLSTVDYKALEKHDELTNEARKIEFSCVGLQSILSQSLINIELFKIHKNDISNFLQTINLAANRVVTISLVTKHNKNTFSNIKTVTRGENNCFRSDNIMKSCDEDICKQNECNAKDFLEDKDNQLYDENDVCYTNKAACEQNCNGICYPDNNDESDVSSCTKYSETFTESPHNVMESGFYEENLYLDQDINSDLISSTKDSIDEKTKNRFLDTTTNVDSSKDKADVVKKAEYISETTHEVKTDSDYDSYIINKQDSKTPIQDSVEDEPSKYTILKNNFEDIEYSSFDVENKVSPYNSNDYSNNGYDNTSQGADLSDSDSTMKSNYELADEGYNNDEVLGLSPSETDDVSERLADNNGDSLNGSVESVTNHEVTNDESHISAVDEDTTTEQPITDGFEYTTETPTTVNDDLYTSYETTTVNYEITTENIESTTSYYYETTTETTTPTYETTTEDLYKVSQDIYSAAQDLSTKANEISSINSDISSKISNINSMVSDLNTYDDDELSKKIQSVSKITQEISSKTSEISSLCSTTSSLASDISSASSDMPSADRHHRFKTSPWQKMSAKCQDMVTACQSIVTAAQEILLNLDNIVSHTETLKVADAVTSGVYDVTAKTQLVISETLNIVSAVIELMNVIES